MLGRLFGLALAVVLLSACFPGLEVSPGPLPPGDPATVEGWGAVTLPNAPMDTPTELFTAGDGVLVRIGDAYYRSDGGQAWRKLTLPADLVRIQPARDSLDRLYAISRRSIAKSVDGGRSWSNWVAAGQASPAIRPHPVGAFAPSAADPNLVYLTLFEQNSSSFHQVWRTRNDGAAWELLFDAGTLHASLCGWSTFLIEPHPKDPRRVFWTSGCIAGRNISGLPLMHSSRQGDDWATARPAADQESLRSLQIFAQWLDGGFSSSPIRWYQAGNNRTMASLAQLARSDDDGVHWRVLLEYVNPAVAPTSTYITAFAPDPVVPDRLYLITETSTRGANPVVEYRARVSDDGGTSWRELPGEIPGAVKKLAISGNGGTLYLLTDAGLFRR